MALYTVQDARERLKRIVDDYAKMHDELESIISGMDELYAETQGTIKVYKNLRYETLNLRYKTLCLTMKNKPVKKLQLVHLDISRAKKSTSRDEFRNEFFAYAQREDC